MSICILSLGVVYIVVKGSQNYTLLLLALVNLVMFICFGILSLTKAYEYYNNNHIPYIKERLKESEQDKLSEETISKSLKEDLRESKKEMNLAEKEPNKQGNDSIHSDSGNNILDSGMTASDTSISDKSVVMDSSRRSDRILSRPIYTRGDITSGFHTSIKENSSEIKE